MMPGMIMGGLFDINRLFLVVFGEAYAPNILCGCVALLHAFNCWLLIFWAECGMMGACYATFISDSILFVGMHAYTSCKKGDIAEAWFLPTRDSLSGWC